MEIKKKINNFKKSNNYRKKVHDYIVGGAHTYSKGDDQFPELSPAAISHGKNSNVWDIDNNKYVDFTLGLGSVGLGHAYKSITQAVIKEINKGVSFQRPSKIELILAEEFLSLLPHMDLVKFQKNGSTVTTAAVKLSRAYTNKPLVAFPGNHPFYSFDDWFIGSKDINSGIPNSLKSLSLKYDSRDPETLKYLFKKYKNKIACVITEPEDLKILPKRTIIEVEKITKKNKAIFVVDEMLSGYRSSFPGSYTKIGLKPDLTTWGKTIGNGFSFCALAGRNEIMKLGGIKKMANPRVFLLSSTHGGETSALAAGLEVIKTYKKYDVIKYHNKIIEKIYKGTLKLLDKYKLVKYIPIYKSSWRIFFEFKDFNEKLSNSFKTLFLQEMIGNGILFQGLILPCFTHSKKDLIDFFKAFEHSCIIYKSALEGDIKKYLYGKPIKDVFRKYI